MDYCVDDIREILRCFVSEKRFKHILGVEREAYKLGKIFIPDKVEKLRLAAKRKKLSLIPTSTQRRACLFSSKIPLDIGWLRIRAR